MGAGADGEYRAVPGAWGSAPGAWGSVPGWRGSDVACGRVPVAPSGGCRDSGIPFHGAAPTPASRRELRREGTVSDDPIIIAGESDSAHAVPFDSAPPLIHSLSRRSRGSTALVGPKKLSGRAHQIHGLQRSGFFSRGFLAVLRGIAKGSPLRTIER